LRGHGTYLDVDADTGRQYLVASVAGTVQRVNKLVSVVPVASQAYAGQVGDLVVGRIASVALTRWLVQLGSGGGQQPQRLASLPLSGVHLPGGIQRVRTSQDAREMRAYLAPGDLVCAEVHKIQAGDGSGSLQLHTRNLEQFGKLENGVCVPVPPALVPRRKNHAAILFDDGGAYDDEGRGAGGCSVLLLFGCNGMIWLQRKLPDQSSLPSATGTRQGGSNNSTLLVGAPELAEFAEARRKQHREHPYSLEDRRRLAVVRNSIECLRLTHSMITLESVRHVCDAARRLSVSPAQMLHPENVLHLTEALRESKRSGAK
jgi:exosome complex component RRP4